MRGATVARALRTRTERRYERSGHRHIDRTIGRRERESCRQSDRKPHLLQTSKKAGEAEPLPPIPIFRPGLERYGVCFGLLLDYTPTIGILQYDAEFVLHALFDRGITDIGSYVDLDHTRFRIPGFRPFGSFDG